MEILLGKESGEKKTERQKEGNATKLYPVEAASANETELEARIQTPEILKNGREGEMYAPSEFKQSRKYILLETKQYAERNAGARQRQ